MGPIAAWQRWIPLTAVLVLFACSPDRITTPSGDTAGEATAATGADIEGAVDVADLVGTRESPYGLLPPPPGLPAASAAPVGRSAAPPKGRAPLVYVWSGAGPPPATTAPSVRTLKAALKLVQPGGTIRMFDGTYDVMGLVVDRPVTIEAAPGADPVIKTKGSGAVGIFVSQVSAGTVTFRGIAYELSVVEGLQRIGILAQAEYDEVVIEDSRFEMETVFGESAIGVSAGASSAPGGRVEVRGSTFRGGTSGAYAVRGGHMDVFASDFSGHWFSGIQYQDRATGRADGNTLSDCGLVGCIRAPSAGPLEIVGNALSNDNAREVWYGIVVLEHPVIPGILPDVLIEGNHVLGTGGNDGDRAFDLDGIRVFRGEATIRDNTVSDAGHGVRVQELTATLSENAIRDAEVGIHVDGADARVSGLDNVVEASAMGIQTLDVGSVAIHSSDFTGYANNVADDLDADLTCNWWGSPYGPTSFTAPDPSVYTPWATEPVAGTFTTTCDGYPLTVVRVEAGVSDPTTSPPTFPTVAEAYDAVAAGGTILVADGVHVVRELFLDRSVTIEAEDDGLIKKKKVLDPVKRKLLRRPVIETDGAPTAFHIVADGETTVRSLRFIGATDPIIISEFGVEDPYDRVLIDDVVIELGEGFTSGVSAWPAVHPPDGRTIEVRRSAVFGGWRGLHVQPDVPNFVAVGNRLSTGDTPGSHAVGFSHGASGRLERNSLSACQGCINVGGGRPDEGGRRHRRQPDHHRPRRRHAQRHRGHRSGDQHRRQPREGDRRHPGPRRSLDLADHLQCDPHRERRHRRSSRQPRDRRLARLLHLGERRLGDRDEQRGRRHPHRSPRIRGRRTGDLQLQRLHRLPRSPARGRRHRLRRHLQLVGLVVRPVESRGERPGRLHALGRGFRGGNVHHHLQRRGVSPTQEFPLDGRRFDVRRRSAHPTPRPRGRRADDDSRRRRLRRLALRARAAPAAVHDRRPAPVRRHRIHSGRLDHRPGGGRADRRNQRLEGRGGPP